MMLFSWALPPETKRRIMRKRKPVTRPMQTQSVLRSVLWDILIKGRATHRS